MFVDSASRLQRPYGAREKSTSAILAVVKRFAANMGVPGASRTDNGTEYTNAMFVEHCNNLGIRRELTAPRTPQQNGPVESAIARAFKAGHAARLSVHQLFPDVRLEDIRGCYDPPGMSLWLESLLWGSECFNRAVSSANDGWLYPHEIFYENHPGLSLLLLFHPAFYRTPRQRKPEPRARMCYFLNFGYNHGRDCYKLLGEETGKFVYSRDVTWHNPEVPWVIPMRVPPTDHPKNMTAPSPLPAPAPAPARIAPATPPAPAPATPSVQPAPVAPTPPSTVSKPPLCPRACPTRVETRRI